MNQQKWLKRKIPNEWMDKDALLELLVFECLVHFVEKEKGFGQSDLDWSKDIESGFISQEYVDRIRRIEGELKHCYNYIKEKRPKMVEKMNATDDGLEFDRLEKEMYEEDTFVMNVIIENRGYMWT